MFNCETLIKHINESNENLWSFLVQILKSDFGFLDSPKPFSQNCVLDKKKIGMCLKLILDFANVTRTHVKSKDLLPKKKIVGFVCRSFL